MAYPNTKTTDSNPSSELYLEKNINNIVELFPASDQDMERLRFFYQETIEEETETQEEVVKQVEETFSEKIDSIGLYLKEMSRVPLLTYNEEVDLARRIERSVKAESKFQKLNANSSHAEIDAIEILLDDGKAARDHLIKANTRLVVSIAKKYINRGVPFLDLIQEGNLGLMKAVEKFDYKLGYRFSTYATWWIRQTITRSIADQGRTIRVPVHMIDRIRNM